uniref:Succinate dehydrogenase [ubiquinone] cytochrome b small subunit n=1 Tax=Setaria digitata TaxID=48799 RepID=A0A915Q7E4_9BILA
MSLRPSRDFRLHLSCRMLSATSRLVSGKARFVYPLLVQRSVAGVVRGPPQFDPVAARKTFKETHDHSTMFKIEKYFSIAMLPLLPTSYFIHGFAMDTALAVAITLHVHWGLHGVLSIQPALCSRQHIDPDLKEKKACSSKKRAANVLTELCIKLHWKDYGRPYVLGPALAKFVQGPFAYILSICLLAGLLHFNSYDVGITKAFELDLKKLERDRSSGISTVPKSVLLATNCSLCFGAVHLNKFMSGCRRYGSVESKTLKEFYGVMCSRNSTYCGLNLCCCSSTNCYDELREHFLGSIYQSEKGVTCDVYRQQWIGNSRRKGLNKSFYPTSEEWYKRSSCAACGSRVDEEGVEMTCIEEDVHEVCRGMDLFVGGAVVCAANGDCCCQGEHCSEDLRNFYSGRQKMLGTPRVFVTLSSSYSSTLSSLIIAIPLLGAVLVH